MQTFESGFSKKQGKDSEYGGESPFKRSAMLTRSYTRAKERSLTRQATSTSGFAPKVMSVFVVSNSSQRASDVNLQSLEPATNLVDEPRKGLLQFKRSETNSTKFHFPSERRESEQSTNTYASPLMKSLKSSMSADEEEFMTSKSSNFRLQRSFSMVQKRDDAPTKLVTIRTEDGDLTEEFKQLLVNLAKKRLDEELTSCNNGKVTSDDKSVALMQGALDYLNTATNNVKDLQVDGAVTMIPEEYRLSARKADQGRSEIDILQFEIERMRGSSMKLGTGQTARKVPKGTTVSSEEENLVRKLVEIGFLLNDRAVTMTIARFIETDNSVCFFKLLGLRQRSKEGGRVLMNKLLSQSYLPRYKSSTTSNEEDDKTLNSTSWSK